MKLRYAARNISRSLSESSGAGAGLRNAGAASAGGVRRRRSARSPATSWSWRPARRSSPSSGRCTCRRRGAKRRRPARWWAAGANPSRSAGMWPPSFGSWITTQVAVGLPAEHLGPVHRGEQRHEGPAEAVRHHQVGAVRPGADVRVVAEPSGRHREARSGRRFRSHPSIVDTATHW